MVKTCKVLVCMFMDTAAHNNIFRSRFVVETAFLNRALSGNIWIKLSHRVSGYLCLGLKLVKEIYLLEQAHFAWHRRLCTDHQTLGLEDLPSIFYVLIFFRAYLCWWCCHFTVYKVDHWPCCEVGKLYEVRVTKNVEWILGVRLQRKANKKRSVNRDTDFSAAVYRSGPSWH